MSVIRSQGAKTFAQGLCTGLSLALLAALALSTLACTNSPTISSKTTKTGLTNPFASISVNLNNKNLAIFTVLPSSFGAGYIDLVGDGSGAMATQCAATGSGSGSQGPSTCQCTYTYTSEGALTVRTVDTVYHDSNLLRCPMVTPASVTSFKVKIHNITDNSDTADYTYSMTGTGSDADPTNALLFAEVQRYQCRPIVTIFPFSTSKVYDPFQSEDSSLTYPLNFYTTNMGFALAVNASGYGAFSPPEGWTCSTQTHASGDGVDLRVFSVGADGGNSIIAGADGASPNGATHNRINFQLAKDPVGVFSIPVNAYIAPGIYTAKSKSAPPPLGYGASPLGDETCPTASLKPTGYRWVKLWLFRATLPARRFLYSERLASLGEVACYAGEWTRFQPGQNIPAGYEYVKASYNDCYGGIKLSDVGAGTPLASRYLGGAQRCITPMYVPGGLLPNQYGAGLSSSLVNASSFPASADVWTPKQAVNTCTPGAPTDYTHLCNAEHVPYDESPAGDYLDKDSSGNVVTRYDFLFVVTPPEVTVNQMKNPSSSEALKYTPMRYMSVDDCPANNPNACLTDRLISSYGLKLNDISTSSDAPGVYPVCVLQKEGS